MTQLDPTDFWSPEFDIETRDDGTILMAQKGALPEYSKVLADYLSDWAQKAPDRPWLAQRDDAGAWRKVTYAEGLDRARRIGARLLKMGLGPDKPLLILSGNSIEHALLGAACFYVGVPYAPVSPAYSLVSKDHAKLKDIADLLRPGAVFAQDGDAFAPAISSIARAGMQTVAVTGPADLFFEDLLSSEPKAADTARAALTPQTVVKYLFTSGSTGSPKAVINTNGMICTMQAMVRDCYRFHTKRPPVLLDWAPWNHTAAGNNNFYVVMTNGGTYYIDDGKPTASGFGETLRNLREVACTCFINVPIGYEMLVDALEKDADLAELFFSDLRLMFYAGAGMAQHTWDRLRTIARETTGREILLATALGATETAPFAMGCTQVQDFSGNVGVPGKGLLMKLVPTGGKLEVRFKGPSITPGYYGDPARTAEAFDEEGYYCMGDALRPADPEDYTKGFFFDGRVAENFKLRTGTWVAVGAVRSALVDAMEGLVRDAVIVGENEAELGALLLLSPRAIEMAPAELTETLGARLSCAAKAATGSASRVMRALILTSEPRFDKGEITEKGSLNQRAMRANHAPEIAGLYQGGDGVLKVCL